MTKGNRPTGGRPRSSPHEGQRGVSSIDALRAAMEAYGAEPESSAQEIAQLEEWLTKVERISVLRQVPLSACTLDLLAQMLPQASVTSELRARLERVRQAERTKQLATKALEAECAASSPPELLRSLRARAGISAEGTADLFGVSVERWLAVEQMQSPWYQLRADALPAFAAAVAEPIERLVDLIAMTARRAVFASVELRAGPALGRFDEGQSTHDVRRDRLRMAFARVNDENRGAAEFLAEAQRIARRRAGPAALLGDGSV